ncbi:MAG: hypothetical protein AAGF45_05970 [Pseudomonadota bacterium]
MRRVWVLFLLFAGVLALSGCGSAPPTAINDVCSVFSQRSGLLRNWYADARRAERRYGIPVHVIMATVRAESGFKGSARPPRRKLLGIVPWKRKSSAYGYSQALNGTWDQYKRETRRFRARRGNFADSVDFVGWYHAKTVQKYGTSPHDAFTLYLGYRYGWTGLRRGSWRNDAGAVRSASRTANFAQTYAMQLRNCR